MIRRNLPKVVKDKTKFLFINTKGFRILIFFVYGSNVSTIPRAENRKGIIRVFDYFTVWANYFMLIMSALPVGASVRSYHMYVSMYEVG
jgi:hypothetical protein